jgi:hypothetical protein
VALLVVVVRAHVSLRVRPRVAAVVVVLVASLISLFLQRLSQMPLLLYWRRWRRCGDD